MEARMDMQGMPKSEMHNTFWRKEQVVVTFHSATPLVSIEGVNQGGPILKQLNLEAQRQKLNTYLAEHGLNYTLNFYKPIEDQDFTVSRPSRGPARVYRPVKNGDSQEFRPRVERRSLYPSASHHGRDSFNPPPGVYLFGLSKPIPSDFGEVATSIATFFDFTPNGDEASSGRGDDGDGKEPPDNQSPVVHIINTFNKGLRTLNSQQVPISAASPNWLWGGTPYVPQGCPLTPPIPVDDACSYWHFHLPLLSPEQLRSMTGEGVTVFVLDTLPEHDVISYAATRAGDDNLLLFDVSRNVTFNYDIWNAWIAGGGDPMIPQLAVGKDVYGRHFAFRMPDHGLLIAGIVHDISPHARVECIRIMGDYCVGDFDLFTSAMQYIQNRMLPGGDLYRRPVVINLSNVMPTREEAQSAGLDPNAGVTDSVLIQASQSITALTELGAIVVAAAGNEGELQPGMRPPALHPAAFGNPPNAIHGVIPVGAVDKDGNATSYSCYPGPNGIATYGGEVPAVDPPEPPSKDPDVIVCDAVRGIYSAARYPALSKDSSLPYSPAPQHKAPNSRGWAYWIGTSFATPIISAVAARVLELQLKGGPVGDVPATITGAGGGTRTLWNDLDPSTPGAPEGRTMGPMLLAMQECLVMEEDDDD
jgi:hypothetical protein